MCFFLLIDFRNGKKAAESHLCLAFMLYGYYTQANTELMTYCNVRVALFDVLTTLLGPVAQSVASPTADPGVASLIPAWSHTIMVIDHEIISMVILLKKDCCQLQEKVCARSTG